MSNNNNNSIEVYGGWFAIGLCLFTLAYLAVHVAVWAIRQGAS